MSNAPPAQPAALPRASSSACALPKGTRLREYEILDVVGEGGFSIVYAARDVHLGRLVAIKEYMPTAISGRESSLSVRVRAERHLDTFEAGRRGFINEGRLLAEFSHPALARVFGFWEENGTAYMAMPLYGGQTLRSVLASSAPADREAWLKGILGPLLDALELLHGHKVFHRDIAPDNIFIQDDGAPLLLDLGSARRILGERQHGLTVVVKPGYAPVEQYAHDDAVKQGPWTDIYALGAVMYYVLTGAPPAASISRLLKDTLSPVAEGGHNGFSAPFLAAIDHALALQVEDRPQSIKAFRSALGLDTTHAAIIPLKALAPLTSHAETSPAHATVVLQAQELAALAAASSSNSAAPREASVPDPFAAPQASERAAATSNAFPEMDDLLAGRLVPPRPDATAPADAPLPATHAPPPPSRKPEFSRLAVLGGGAVVIVAVVFAVIWQILGDPRPVSAAPVPPPPVPVTQHVPDVVTALPPQSQAPTESVAAMVSPPSQDAAPVSSPPSATDSATHPLPVVTVVGDDRNAPSPSPPPSPPQPPETVAPPKPATAEATGTLTVASWPWSEVWVDGRKRGVSPPLRELRLPPGEHVVELRNPAFPPVVKKVSITTDGNARVHHNFTDTTSAQDN